MSELSILENRIKKIEERNKRVEKDKAWETSYARKILLMIFTYLSIGIYMYFIKVPNPWLNAFIPTVGFFLSTLTLPLFKTLWQKHDSKG